MRHTCYALFLLLVIGGCQRLGGPGPGTGNQSLGGGSGSVPVGVYQGVVEMEGGEIPSALQVLPVSGREVKGILQLPGGIVAEGTGTLVGNELRLEMAYGGQCPGRIVLVGNWTVQTDTLSGVIEASDCTGKAEGVFRFTGVMGSAP